MVDRADYETTLDPDRTTHLGIRRDEHDDLTREFFAWDVPELPTAVIEAMEASLRDDVQGVNLDNLDGLLRPGYLPIETGIASCDNGEGSVAVWTAWPGTTPEMIDWWFGWHMARTERYKLWHPQAHAFAQPRYDLSSVEGLTDRERYVGNTSWVDEYIGPALGRLAISFHDPAEIGLDQATLDAADYGTVVYATVADSDEGRHLAYLIHAVRRTDGGSEMRSRFIFPPGVAGVVGPAMIDHCYTEMTHLAGFLPHLHARVTAARDENRRAPRTGGRWGSAT